MERVLGRDDPDRGTRLSLRDATLPLTVACTPGSFADSIVERLELVRQTLHETRAKLRGFSPWKFVGPKLTRMLDKVA